MRTVPQTAAGMVAAIDYAIKDELCLQDDLLRELLDTVRVFLTGR